MKKIIGIFTVMIMLVSCGEHQHPNNTAGHDHQVTEQERATRSVTVYSEKFEIFTEYDALQVGGSSGFLIHVTRLDEDYSAYSDGAVKVRMESNGKVSVTEAKPVTGGGIFKASIEPEEAGQGQLYFTLATGAGEETLPAGSVTIFSQDDEPPFEEEAGSSLIKFTKEQAWKSRFNVTQVRKGSFAKVVKTSGEFMPMPGEKQHIVARAEGIVLFGSRGLVQGKQVKAGEEMFTISDKGFVDNNLTVQFNKARINFEKSRSDYLRHSKLRSENVISERQFLETKEDYLNDSVIFFSFKETMSSSGMKIFSPMNGYVHELDVSEGQYVRSGDLMTTVSSNEVMLLRADLPQQYYNLLGEITTANFRPSYADQVYSVDDFSGKLIAKGASVAENNHYMPVYFEVENDGTLLEGAFAEFYLMTDPEPGHIVIPNSAVLEEQGNYYVYVQVDGEHFQKRPVKVLATNGMKTSVMSGLDEGERIVSEGVMLVKTATSAALPSHGHSH